MYIATHLTESDLGGWWFGRFYNVMNGGRNNEMNGGWTSTWTNLGMEVE